MGKTPLVGLDRGDYGRSPAYFCGDAASIDGYITYKAQPIKRNSYAEKTFAIVANSRFRHCPGRAIWVHDWMC
ncbi:hypothetical protein H6F75_15335 [Nodosilinea sp. FACHB-131]|uniref:hypothetical protein n=1 Tax=Cyanophyceae TaxID=3028117 RepID=UPI001685F097|nr:hypothetical protein [Nodosilinea sp. FACHB-131]MBD1874859.1 hypothetical protein [Nodosilinea sp. FACHB-131]